MGSSHAGRAASRGRATQSRAASDWHFRSGCWCGKGHPTDANHGVDEYTALIDRCQHPTVLPQTRGWGGCQAAESAAAAVRRVNTLTLLSTQPNPTQPARTLASFEFPTASHSTQRHGAQLTTSTRSVTPGYSRHISLLHSQFRHERLGAC